MIVPAVMAKGYILAALMTCPAQPAPSLTLDFSNKPVQFDNTQSSRELVKLQNESVSPHYGAEFPIVGGITSGVFQARYNMNFRDLHDSEGHQDCLWIKDVTVTVTYTPTVYIASGYHPGSCRYNLTQGHEMMHVNIDEITAREFLPGLKKALTAALAQADGVGPIDESKVKGAQSSFTQWFSAAVNTEMEKLQQLRAPRQRQVDSRQEYRRMSTACPDELAH